MWEYNQPTYPYTPSNTDCGTIQWYVAEQIEEEALARTINDKLELIGDDKGGLYLFDRDILMVSVVPGDQ